ncbi:capsular associated protein [Colletotrichum paranaense]|uniref:Capsular associated protein n=1 Tax=Colletotrichum paranaense TaxID=1914294 RepID=A0ABQ9S1K7_9PEZI|nr:capsular associated protein [Colletotrichum paranaense]KAK1522680.1 capsular associated protein [Colletotrichum paranaense]
MVKLIPPSFPPRRPSSFLRYAAAVIFFVALFYYFDPRYPREPLTQLQPEKPKQPPQTPDPVAPGQVEDVTKPTAQAETTPIPPKADQASSGVKPPSAGNTKVEGGVDPSKGHPIDALIKEADETFDKLLEKETKTLPAAAKAYRERRGRHPPPGFDAWFQFAQDRKAVIVEDFFDQIYHDLKPFWGLEPSRIRKEAAEWEMVIKVRKGRATRISDWFWTIHWTNMLKTIEHLLPDMDIALNPMDEPRMVVPFEDMEQHLRDAALTEGMPEPKKVMNTFQALPSSKKELDRNVKVKSKHWDKVTKQYWLIARRGCPPDSPARLAKTQRTFNHAPAVSTKYAKPHMRDGFVSNYTLSTHICHQPDLQGLNGIFIEPLSTAATPVLFPMFGGSKLAVNNEILLPAAMYWTEEERFSGGGYHGGRWNKKKDAVLWRGVATGGRNRVDNWQGFQRHRFVAMNNATKVTGAEDGTMDPINFSLPDKMYNIAAQAVGGLGDWIKSWANVGFTDLMCEPEGKAGTCNYTSPYFNITEGVMLSEMYDNKYLPDVDGNSFSGRYLAFLGSTSLPIKSTLWREWHDSRLVAWKHFVPMDTRYNEYYGIMEYFLGYGDERPGHDAEAEKIAMAGKAWAEKALRKEDMQIYTLRLLLEYARVTDERRERMGWVHDLLAEQTSS